ncbi:MAG: 3-deoxy-D-manno-octulosonic acid transferase, partial [Chitinophagales bacterium]|nr:3-deoxy-D-manno-octulosonic acid transferase [Chitinophagales bacterium]
MPFFFNLFYNSIIGIYGFAIFISSWWNQKAKQWIAGRKNLFSHIESSMQAGETRVWFHCASVGEFEQGRPVMEAYRKNFPQHKIVLTFFSPSGFELRKNYCGADYIFYLPLDTKANAKKFISLIQPQLAVFVKYEFWKNHLLELQKQKVKTILISAVFRSNQIFFKWYGKEFLKLLKIFECIFLQDENSLQLLKNYGIENASVAGDTRYDRVWQIAQAPKEIQFIKNFKANKKLFVAGSTWNDDEKIILQLVASTNDDWKFVIVPHEIDTEHLKLLKNSSPNSITSSASNTTDEIADHKILIVDEVGLLSSIYQYADIAFIGGGFGKGIHNTLEAAVFGIPVLFGPNYKKFNEAKALIENGGGKAVKDFEELKTAFAFYQLQENISSGKKNYDWVLENCGATEKIMTPIKEVNS